MLAVEEAISTVNSLFQQIHINLPISSTLEIVPSVFVAIYEGLFHSRLEGLVRGASSFDAAITNIRILLEKLEQILNIDLSHIQAEDVVDGEEAAVCDLVEIFGELAKALRGESNGENKSPRPSKKSPRKVKTQEVHKERRTIPFRDDITEYLERHSYAHQDDIDTSKYEGEKTRKPSSRKYQTPAALRITKEDTPHSRILKQRRARLMRQYHEQMGHSDSGLGASDAMFFKDESEQSDLSLEAENDSDFTDWLTRKESKDAPNYAEENLAAFESLLMKEIPLSQRKLPKGIREKTWSDIVNVWKRGLDGRAWDKKVTEIKHRKQEAVGNKWADMTERQWRKSVSIEARSRMQGQILQAKKSLEERKRAVIRMEKKLTDATEDSQRLSEACRLAEEQVLQGLMKDYVKELRDTIIEARQNERRDAIDAISKREEMNARKHQQLADKVAHVESKLRQDRTTENITKRAQEQYQKRIIRDTKSGYKTSIKRNREKFQTNVPEKFSYQLGENLKLIQGESNSQITRK